MSIELENRILLRSLFPHLVYFLLKISKPSYLLALFDTYNTVLATGFLFLLVILKAFMTVYTCATGLSNTGGFVARLTLICSSLGL